MPSTAAGWNFSLQQIAALGKAIEEFDPRTVERGERYHRQKRVLALEPDAGSFRATVAGTEIYEVTWTLDGRRWDADCSCPVGVDCKHAYAAALAAMSHMVQAAAAAKGAPPAKNGSAPAKVDPRTPGEKFADETGARISAARSGLTIKAAERRFLLALHKLWTEVRDRPGILPHQLARLGLNLPLTDHERWGVGGPLLAGWWEPPLGSPLELGNFLAAFCARRGGKWPAFLAKVTDPMAAEASVARRERERAVGNWKKVFERPPPPGADAPPAPALASSPTGELRLRLTAPTATWETRPAPDAAWTPVKPAVVKGWLERALLTARPLPEVGRPLLQAFLLSHLGLMARGRTFPLHTLRLASEEVRAGLAPLLADRALLAAGSIVAADGSTLAVAPAADAAHWRAEPVPGAADDLRFALARADGAPLADDALLFPGAPGVVLDGNTLRPLPPAFPGSEGYTPIVVPREALQTPAALRTLRRLRAEAPPDALPPHEIIPLRPLFHARMRRQDEGEVLGVELLARSADGAVEQRHGPHGWTGGGKRPKDGPERLLELEAADGAVLSLGRLNAAWSDPLRAWTLPVSRDFPERFIAWAEGVREDGFDLECSPDLAGLLRPPDRARLDVDLLAAGDGAGRDWFDLKLVARPEDTTLSPEEIRLLLAAPGRFVRLPGKGWRRLELDVPEERAAALRDLGVEPSALDPAGETQRFHALQLAGDDKIAGLLPGEHLARLRLRAAEIRAMPPPALPAGLRATLRPYQEEGFQFLAFLARHGFGGVLADDMGLGKTVQALAWLLWLRGEARAAEGAPPFRALVVCPKSVTHNWFSEAARFAPDLRVHVFRPSAPWPAPGEAELIVANYTQLRLGADRFQSERWTAAILDEGQNIKNPSSQTAGAARGLPAEHRLVLTGTPIENRLLDLWSLFAFVMPGLLGNRAAFGRLYGERADAATPGGSVGNARERLARRTRHFLLRRTKAQVAPELPPRVEEDLLIDLEGKQRALYDAELKRARQALLALKTPREFDRQRMNFLQSLLRLRQICGDPALVGQTGANSAKRDALWETVEPLVAEGHKVLIFSQFVSMLELLADDLRARKLGFLMLTGQTENRAALVEEFQTSPAVSVFLLSLKAAGAGLNLTAASYVVLYDPWWNPAVEAQAIDRTHRIGQANPVLAYRLLARNTVEEKIRQMQREKAALAASVVGEESLATVMDLESLRFMLG